MTPRVHLAWLACVLTAGGVTDARAGAASPHDEPAPVAAFVVSEATAGDLNGDGDAADAVVQVLNTDTGDTINLGLAVPLVCDSAVLPPRCSPVQPVAGDEIVAILVSEAAQGASDLTGDGDAFDEVLFVYDARSGEVRSTELAVAHGRTRSVSFITFPMVPVVLGDVAVFLVGEGEQGGTDLNHDGDAGDAVVHLVSPKKRHKAINVALAAPRIGFFQSPVLVASGDNRFVSVLVGEPEQGRDLNRDGDADDLITMSVRVQNGKARPAD
jgi:hypothetical protein